MIYMSDDITRVFIDTNILVYANDSSSGIKHVTASQIIEELWDSRLGCLSLQVLQEFYVTVVRKVANPLDPKTARDIVKDLKNWSLHIPSAQDLLDSIDIHQAFKISLWDAMIVNSAVKMGCNLLLTEDLNHGQDYYGVKVRNPFLR